MKTNRHPLPHEVDLLRSNIRVQENQLRQLAHLVHEKSVEKAQLEEEVDTLTTWLEVALAAKDSAERTCTALEALQNALTAENQLEQQVEGDQSDLVSRVRHYGRAGTHFMTDEVMKTGTSIQSAAENRVKAVSNQLDAAQSLLHFASLDLEGLTLSHDATYNALAAVRAFVHNINALPNELLLKIFRQVVNAEITTRNQMILGFGGQAVMPNAVVSPLRIGAVSSRWRKLTRACSELWRVVSVKVSNPSGFGFSSELQRIPHRQLQRMRHYLQHSKNSELDLVVNIGGNTDLEKILEAITPNLSNRSISELIVNATHLDMLRRTPGGGVAIQTASGLPGLVYLLAQLPPARSLKLTLSEKIKDHNTADLFFIPKLGSLSSCTSITCFGVRPIPPSPGAQTVQHLSITRTSNHNSWNLNAILSSFPNLAYLEIDSALAGCIEELDDNPEMHACILPRLKRISTSLTGLDDLNKSLQRRLSLPSFNHLTLAGVEDREKAPEFVWIVFSAGGYAAKITTLEVMECSASQFIDLRSLSTLNTLKLHSKAVQGGLKSFAIKPSDSAEDPLPASLKEMHLFDSTISGNEILGYFKQIRSNCISHKWTCSSRLHLSGCLNITRDFRSKLEDEGDYYVHLYSTYGTECSFRCDNILRTLLRRVGYAIVSINVCNLDMYNSQSVKYDWSISGLWSY